MEIEIDIDRNDGVTMYHCWQLLTNWDSQIRRSDRFMMKVIGIVTCDVSCEKYNSGDVHILLAMASAHVAGVGR